MIKFLYFTDTHIRGTAPKNRLDSFPETLKNKISQVIEIAKNEQVDVLLHGGDVFDRLIYHQAQLASLLKSFGKLMRQFIRYQVTMIRLVIIRKPSPEQCLDY